MMMRVMMMMSIRRKMMMEIMMKAMTMMLFQSGLPHLVTSGQRSYVDDEGDGGDDELDVFLAVQDSSIGDLVTQ